MNRKIKVIKCLVLSGFMAYGIGAAMEVWALYSTLAHFSAFSHLGQGRNGTKASL